MTDKQQTIVVELKGGRACVELVLPLEADGTLQKRYEPLLSVTQLTWLLDSVMDQMSDDKLEDKVVFLEDSQAMLTLLEVLLHHKQGEQLLKVIRGHLRSTEGQVGGLLRSLATLEKLANADDAAPKDKERLSLERRARRDKKKL
jgi:hypothetical protein